MKLTLRKYILPLLVSVSMLFAACSDISNLDSGEETAKKSTETAQIQQNENFDLVYIKIGLAENSARTAIPVMVTDSDTELDKYSWTLRALKKNESETAHTKDSFVNANEFAWDITYNSFSAMKSAAIGLVAGSYSFQLTADIDGTVPASGSETTETYADAVVYTGYALNQQISSDSATLSFQMSLTSINTAVTGDGSLEVKLYYTPIDVASVTAKYYSIDSSTYAVTGTGTELAVSEAQSDDNGKYFLITESTGTTIPNGFYAVRYTFFDADGHNLGTVPDYANIVKNTKSVGTKTVTNLDNVCSITYETPVDLSSLITENVIIAGSFTRNSEMISLPKASQMDDSAVTFCGWYDNSSFSGTPITEINPKYYRNSIKLYGRFINSAEAKKIKSVKISYLLKKTGTTDEYTNHVGNTARVTAYTDENGTSGSEFKGTISDYQWYTYIAATTEPESAAVYTLLDDATASTYKITSSLVDKTLAVGVKPLYTVTPKRANDEDDTSEILYYNLVSSTESKGHDSSAIENSTVDVTGLKFQYAGYVAINAKPQKSLLKLSGILADEYGNAVTTYEGDLESYEALTASKKINVSISVPGYTPEGNMADGAAQVYVPVRYDALTSTDVSLVDAARANAEAEGTVPEGFVKIALPTDYANNWQYVIAEDGEDPDATKWTDVPSDGLLPEAKDLTTVFTDSKVIWLRLKSNEDTAKNIIEGKDNYIYPSEPLPLYVTKENIGNGGSTVTNPLEMMTGPEIRTVFNNSFSSAKTFAYTTATAPSTAKLISTENSGVDVKAWLSGTNLYVTASDYDGSDRKLPLNENISYMFAGLSRLVSVDLTGFDLSAVKNMSHLFDGCTRLTTVKFGATTALLTDISYMFYNSGIETVDLSPLVTNGVENMSYMFANSFVTSLDLHKLDTSAVTEMQYMFNGASDLTEIVFVDSADTENNKFVTTSVKKMKNMFAGTGIAELDVSSFNTQLVEDMSNMFSGMLNLEYVILGNFNISAVTTMDEMFSGDTSLGKIYVIDSSTDWSIEDNTFSGKNMFLDCSVLVGQDGVTYSSAKVTKAYAKVSGGYFTTKN